MAIDSTAELFFGIVEVHAAQPLEADDAVEFSKDSFGAGSGAQVVSAGKGVTGVDADTDAGLVLYFVDDGGKVFEAETQIGALAGGVFDNGSDAAGVIEGDVDGFGDELEAGCFVDLFEVAAGVKVELFELELFTAFHFVVESIA